jgi:lantibiotic biosynthesis protein
LNASSVGTWAPLLDGSDKERALRTASAIAEAVGRVPIQQIGPSLPGGTAGLALLHMYLDQAIEGRGYDDAAANLLEASFAGMAALRSVWGLYSGPLGIGFAVQHLSGMFESEGDDPLDELDVWALELLRRPLEQMREYDLVGGWVGVGVYALERLPRRRAKELLTGVIERLVALAEPGRTSFAWHHANELLPPIQQSAYPEGWYNLGMAHGMPGIVALLGEAIRAGVEAVRCREILERLIPWMLEQRVDGSIRFPTLVGGRGARAAWCYGDPGVAIALLGAGLAAENAEWRGLAIELAKDVAVRPDAVSGVDDAMLCHGASGLAHLFNRMFQATRETIFADAARRWVQKTLAMQVPGTGIAGFRTFEPKTPGDAHAREDEECWKPTPGILTGAAGVALVLVAASCHVEPCWDRMLLTRVPLSR